eukprot:scaffold141785_cov26-Tisochrysis_lutea.AAC.1
MTETGGEGEAERERGEEERERRGEEKRPREGEKGGRGWAAARGLMTASPTRGPCLLSPPLLLFPFSTVEYETLL